MHVLKCLHSGKQCQVAYVKTYLNMQCNGKFGGVLQNITFNVSVVKYWTSGFFPNENPPSRKEVTSYYCIALHVKISFYIYAAVQTLQDMQDGSF